MPIDDNTLHGAKTRAGQLLSKYIRKIAVEETELIVDPEQGDKMATKAEALARIIWKHALGFTETVKEKIGDAVTEREYKRPPNLAYIQLLYNRLEGKDGEKRDNKPTAADRVTKQGVDRINDAGSLKT